MKIMLLIITLLLASGLYGCGTMEGLGKDIKSLGDKIEKKAGDSE